MPRVDGVDIDPIECAAATPGDVKALSLAVAAVIKQGRLGMCVPVRGAAEGAQSVGPERQCGRAGPTVPYRWGSKQLHDASIVTGNESKTASGRHADRRCHRPGRCRLDRATDDDGAQYPATSRPADRGRPVRLRMWRDPLPTVWPTNPGPQDRALPGWL
jgi:hypothetical protein